MSRIEMIKLFDTEVEKTTRDCSVFSESSSHEAFNQGSIYSGPPGLWVSPNSWFTGIVPTTRKIPAISEYLFWFRQLATASCTGEGVVHESGSLNRGRYL